MPTQRKPDVLIGVPHVGTVEVEWAVRLSQLYAFEMQRRVVSYTFTRGAPIDVDRNKIVTDLIRQDAQWLFFLDSDNMVSPDVIERLMAHKQPIVSALYFRRHPPITPAVWLTAPREHWDKGKYVPVQQFQKNSLIEAHVIGMGSCLIHQRVFEKINPEAIKYIREHGNEDNFQVSRCKAFRDNPWFRWTLMREEIGISEDFEFCELVRAAGFKILVDTGIVVPHGGQTRMTMDSGKQPPNLLRDGGIEVTFPEL